MILPAEWGLTCTAIGAELKPREQTMRRRHNRPENTPVPVFGAFVFGEVASDDAVEESAAFGVGSDRKRSQPKPADS